MNMNDGKLERKAEKKSYTSLFKGRRDLEVARQWNSTRFVKTFARIVEYDNIDPLQDRSLSNPCHLVSE